MLTKLIHGGLIKQRENEPAREYIGASIIGHPCSRKIWYEYNNYPAKEFTPELLMTFEIGRILEQALKVHLINFNDNCEYKLTQTMESENKEIKGTPDAIMSFDDENYIIEIKTANNASFNQFVSHGLRAWRPQYYAQLNCYLGMSRIQKGILLCINKDNSKLREEQIEFNESYYKTLLLKAQSIKAATEPPNRIAETPLHPICRMCPYKTTCFL